MTGKTTALYEKVFGAFFDNYSEEMEGVQKIFLRTDNEPGQYSAFENVANTKGKDVVHNLCYFHWAALYTKKFKKIDSQFFAFDENLKRCKNYKYYLFIKCLPMLSFHKIYNIFKLKKVLYVLIIDKYKNIDFF